MSPAAALLSWLLLAAPAGGGGVVHYTEVRGASRTEIWSTGSRSRELVHFRGLRWELSLAGLRETSRIGHTVVTQRDRRRVPKAYGEGPCPWVAGLGYCGGMPTDPVEVVRRLWLVGRLWARGPGELVGVRLRVRVDPRTGIPLAIDQRSRKTAITGYRRLPASDRLVRLRPHPGARRIAAPCGWQAAVTASGHGFTEVGAQPCGARRPR